VRVREDNPVGDHDAGRATVAPDSNRGSAGGGRGGGQLGVQLVQWAWHAFILA
jgi:hypothetical protein